MDELGILKKYSQFSWIPVGSICYWWHSLATLCLICFSFFNLFFSCLGIAHNNCDVLMYALWSGNYELIQVPVRRVLCVHFIFCETTSVCGTALGKAVSQIFYRACCDGKTQGYHHFFKLFFLKHIQCRAFSFFWSFDWDFNLLLLFRLSSLSWNNFPFRALVRCLWDFAQICDVILDNSLYFLLQAYQKNLTSFLRIMKKLYIHKYVQALKLHFPGLCSPEVKCGLRK